MMSIILKNNYKTHIGQETGYCNKCYCGETSLNRILSKLKSCIN